eukprot:scaffold42383_cov62-Attheya_sp.AAC.1
MQMVSLHDGTNSLHHMAKKLKTPYITPDLATILWTLNFPVEGESKKNSIFCSCPKQEQVSMLLDSSLSISPTTIMVTDSY